jgi:hypothetical protein
MIKLSRGCTIHRLHIDIISWATQQVSVLEFLLDVIGSSADDDYGLMWTVTEPSLRLLSMFRKQRLMKWKCW